MHGISLDRRAFVNFAVAGVITVSGTRAARAQGTAGPTGPIETLNATLVAAMKAGSSMPFRQRYDMVASTIERTFDLNAVLMTSIGQPWATLSAEDQRRLQATFRRYTIASYVANFDSYAGETLQVAPDVRALGDGDQVVTTRIVPKTGTPTVLSYVMHQTGDGWKAIDVLADGTISRVAVQRSDFRGLLRQGSGALVTSLARKVADLSGGALA
jgi:phospholipid transport system substrate-binding protein